MRAFMVSVAVAIVIAAGMAYVLNGSVQRSAADAYTTSGARVGDPGHNLVGKNWSGS